MADILIVSVCSVTKKNINNERGLVMGGFANLKKDFEQYLRRPHDGASKIPSSLEYLVIRTLFEINGNLDQIAIEMKKQTEMVELYRGFLDHLSNQPQYSYYNATKSKTREEEAL